MRGEGRGDVARCERRWTAERRDFARIPSLLHVCWSECGIGGSLEYLVRLPDPRKYTYFLHVCRSEWQRREEGLAHPLHRSESLVSGHSAPRVL
jgi:hypothetical protein